MSAKAGAPTMPATMSVSAGYSCDRAEHDEIAPVEALAGEELGEGGGERIVGVPHEQAEEEPAGHHDADDDGKKHRAGLECEARDRIDGAHAKQKAEQKEGDDAADQSVGDGRLKPLAERFAGLGQGRQTFSTSGRPSSPVGKKMSTMASIEKAATSLYSMLK